MGRAYLLHQQIDKYSGTKKCYAGLCAHRSVCYRAGKGESSTYRPWYAEIRIIDKDETCNIMPTVQTSSFPSTIAHCKGRKT